MRTTRCCGCWCWCGFGCEGGLEGTRGDDEEGTLGSYKDKSASSNIYVVSRVLSADMTKKARARARAT